MKFYMMLLMGLLSIQSEAQDKWTVFLNKKPVLQSSVESENNLVKISAASLKNKNLFTLTYIEQPRQKGWTRSIMVFDSTDRELKRVKSNKISYSNAALLAILKKNRQVQIYTWSIPDDPALKERIRVRRVHLCTLVLE